ncbi:MAG: hypothetical protein ABR602_15320, partial [Gemmatimonadales bacterium]
MSRHRSVVHHLLLIAVILVLPGTASVSAQPTPAAALTAGLPFRTIGPAQMSGRFVDVAVYEAQPHVWYAASSTGGLWKTTNNGVTFTAQFNREGTHSIGAVVLHQRDTSLVWLGSGERANRQSTSWGDGVYKSADGGATWTNMGLGESHHVGRIVLHPDNPDLVYVAAMGHLWGPNPDRGLYRSQDGGRTWELVLFVDEDTGVVDVAMDPRDPRIMYAASYQRRRTPFGFNGGGPGSALWKSTDGGSTWRKLTTGLPAGDYGRIGITIYRSDPRIVYISLEQGLRYTASTAYEEPLAGVYRSEDRGETWQHMGTWNPRPMYASQPMVDPNDDCRLYMVNFWSMSEDCGRTFRQLPQSLHGDDRAIWINPANSDHIIKADDGGMGISYDRARTWLYMTHLPVSQFYRVSVDMRKPYWVYGGLQDNGSWAGPSATYRSEGVLNMDWIKTGGGDGFVNLVDTTDHRTLYTESQYLGLSRMDLVTGERTAIRPGDPEGAISARRNWATWGDPSLPEQRLGNAMAPANWDGPFILSRHDPRTLYAGTNILWKSSDRGEHWTALGDRTTGTDRRTLPIMGERPTERTLSLDDGVPYWPGLTVIAESPFRRGVLYVGTDDGNLQRSTDDGRSWTELKRRVPGLPANSWINGIEASSHVDARLYLVANNYRNGDFANYVFRSEDDGQTWMPIVAGLPANRVARTLREDLRNPEVLYLGTELGLFWSNDRGRTWAELRGNLPMMAYNDLAIHPRENDLILGTHSRGIWILDRLNALQELTPSVTASAAHLFSIAPAEQIRYRAEKGHNGDMLFRGDNPPAGAIIDFWVRVAGDILLSYHDADGMEVARQSHRATAGLNRVTWNLSHTEPGQPVAQAPRGPLVVPGLFTVRLTAGEVTAEQRLDVREDPRIEVDPAVRRAWTATLLELARLRRDAQSLATQAGAAEQAAPTAGRSLAAELVRETRELTSRASRLYGEVNGRVGP